MDSQVQEIKDKLSINEVVGQYVKLERAGRNWRARCPFHKEKTPSFHVSPERGSYTCFGCGEKGDIFTFVEKIEHVDFRTALQQLAQKAGVVLKNTYVPKQEDKQHEEKLRDVCEDATKFFEAELKKRSDVLEYIKGRGVTDETIASWRIGYAPASWRHLSDYLTTQGHNKELQAEAGLVAKSQNKPGEVYDRFRGRIMFPLFDAGGKVIAFSGRYFEKVEGSREEGEPAKYVNSPETPIFKKSRVLYGLDRAKSSIRQADCILLVEGQFDVIMSHQSGLRFAVASSGTAITEEHMSLLSRFSKRLILALDGDAAGIRAGLKSTLLAYKLGFDVKIPVFHGAKDPADLAKENPELLKTAIRNSKTAVEFFLDVLRPEARDERAYAKLLEAQVVPLLAALNSKIEQAHFVRLVANRLRVPETAIYAEVAKRPALPSEDAPVVENAGNNTAPLSSFDKKVGMLYFSFGNESAIHAELRRLLGEAKLQEIVGQLEGQRERLEFEFDTEVGAHSTEDAIAGDMLDAIKRVIEKERVKQQFV